MKDFFQSENTTKRGLEMKVLDVFNYIDSFAPFSSQEEWDNSGHLLGSLNSEVTKAVVCLDVSNEVIDYAVKIGANLIVSHHPVIFSPVKTVTDDSYLYDALIHGISVISAHTNLDRAPGGVNDTLSELLSFRFQKVYDGSFPGFVNVCYAEKPFTAESLSSYLREKLSCAVSYCDTGEKITRIGLCTGAGADFIDDAIKLGCDAFITGEAKYHEFLEAKEKGISLFTVGHFESEIPVVKKLTDKLNNEFNCTVFCASPFAGTVITEK